MARKNQYEIGIAADTSGLEKEISNGLVDPLEDAADAFDDLEKAAKGADLDKEIDKAQKATDDLDDELDDARDSLKKLGYAAKDAGDDSKRGMDRAEEGVKEFGEEANSTAKEAAASFDGSAESIIDAFQEVAANAFAGFGPAGAIAGLAIAAGIGMAVTAFQDAEEAAEELRQKTLDYANDAADAGVTTEAWLSASEQVVERIRELQNTKDNGPRLWFMEDPDELEKWTRALKDVGRQTTEVEDVLSGTTKQVKNYRKAIDDAYDATKREATALIERNKKDPVDGYLDKVAAIRKQQEGYQDLLALLDDEIDLRDKSADASKRQKEAGIDAALAQAEAEEEKADRIAAAEDAVKSSVLNAYDSMRDAATEYATNEKGALDINRWLDYITKHKAAVAEYQANLEKIRLSPEQWQNLLEMPEAQRTQWVAQFAKLPEDARAPFAAALNDVGSTGGSQAAVAFDDSFNPNASVKVDVDTSTAESDLTTLAKAKRTAEIKVKTTGKTGAKKDLDALAKTRHATIQVRANTDKANNTVEAWRRRQQNRPVYITVKAKTGGTQLI